MRLIQTGLDLGPPHPLASELVEDGLIKLLPHALDPSLPIDGVVADLADLPMIIEAKRRKPQNPIALLGDINPVGMLPAMVLHLLAFSRRVVGTQLPVKFVAVLPTIDLMNLLPGSIGDGLKGRQIRRMIRPDLNIAIVAGGNRFMRGQSQWRIPRQYFKPFSRVWM